MCIYIYILIFTKCIIILYIGFNFIYLYLKHLPGLSHHLLGSSPEGVFLNVFPGSSIMGT